VVAARPPIPLLSVNQTTRLVANDLKSTIDEFLYFRGPGSTKRQDRFRTVSKTPAPNRPAVRLKHYDDVRGRGTIASGFNPT
jgi:hypothetical protein